MQLCGSWAFFGIAFLWDWNENWLFPVLWPLLCFPNLLVYWVQHLTASSFRIWNSSAGITSPLLALFVVMLPKAHLTSNSRMSGSVWMIMQSWLSGSLRYILYLFFCLFLPPLLTIVCFCYVHTISVLYCVHLFIKCPLVISKCLEEMSYISYLIFFLYFSPFFS